MNALADAFTYMEHQCDFYKGEDEPIDYSGYDIIILDTYLVTDDYIASLNSPDRLVVCYDDNALFTYECDVLLNANLHANELNFRFGNKKPVLLLGGKYALLRGEFRDSSPLEVHENANNVFVCFGGSDAQDMTPKVVRTLKEIEGINLSVVLGAYTKNDDEVLPLSDKSTIVYKTPKEISKVIKNCEVAVTAAGSMIYELASLGVPSIVIVQADNQELIAEYMARNELLINVGSSESNILSDLKREVSSLLLDYKKRKSLSKNMLENVDKNGAMNAADEILRIASEHMNKKGECRHEETN